MIILVSIKENVKDITIPSEEKRDILALYRSDIENGATFSKFNDTFFWLQDSMITNQYFNCTDPNVGLALNEDRTYIKCYMGDTGLLISHAFTESEIESEELYKHLILGRLSINEGMIFENAIAQTLVSNGYDPYFYVHYNKEKHRNDIEIDFLISNKSKTRYRIFPIEVKSTDKYSTTSLERFIEKYQSRIGQAYVIHTKNLRVSDKIMYIPAYMTVCFFLFYIFNSCVQILWLESSNIIYRKKGGFGLAKIAIDARHGRYTAGNAAALTITPLAGETRPVSAHLVITQLQ